MGKNIDVILSGFGGQGLLFAGKIIAQAGLIEGRHLSWLPSYGPEMRGGTANCSVRLQDDPIGSPLITTPNVLIAMNQPSIDKFIDSVVPGGLVLVDSTLVPRIPERDDVTIIPVPSTELAEKHGFKKLSNVILTGKLFAETHFCEKEHLQEALVRCVPAKHADMLEPNKTALAVGMEL
ncbi:MAG: 2-oxoacid:acceptor oxidoreductase family protein [Eggerthellaceae bacterium]|jgi:2-oxoglutarate ferredoxin oxidoreductase subunit gamma|nr:2-oxoacid:acceptor oxidoreductase family protein [Eggerthellaceae bacterium]MCH4221165.1 2-oxoacid:acceptor oxidoreductase family protein [Eggerthellaceae bacterium]